SPGPAVAVGGDTTAGLSNPLLSLTPPAAAPPPPPINPPPPPKVPLSALTPLITLSLPASAPVWLYPTGAVVTELTVVSLICRRCARSRSDRFEMPDSTLCSLVLPPPPTGEALAVAVPVGEVVAEEVWPP